MHTRRRRIASFHYQNCRDDVDAKVFGFLYACVIPFNILRSPYWHDMVNAINNAPEGCKSIGYYKARTMGLYKQKAKIHNALGQLTNDWIDYGVSFVSDGWTNVKSRQFIMFCVSASGVVFLAVHDYLYCYKTDVNIAEPLLKTIQ